jgi:thiol peroxidase
VASITLGGNPCETVGELPETGSEAPGFELLNDKLEPVSLSDFEGQKVILNIFPSIDTGVCAKSERTFNERASDLDDTAVVSVSMDLPFALGRFCAAEGIENVAALSAFRSSFGDDYGAEIADGGFAGLLSRAVVVLDADHKVVYTEQVDEIGHEPDYDAAIEAASNA